MHYPSLKDFMNSLSEKNISVKETYLNENNEFEEVPNGFYPSFSAYINESEKADSGMTIIENMDSVTCADGTVINMEELSYHMNVAKVAVINQAPLFSTFVNQFTPIFTFGVQTMATDGEHLFVNPQFAMKLSYLERIFVLLHEIMHCVLNHIVRMEGRVAQATPAQGGDPVSVWNLATDYEINAILVDTFPAYFSKELVKGGELHGLYDDKWLNEAAEHIYTELINSMPTTNPPPEQGKGKGKPQPIVLKVGDKVRIKPNGNKGEITAVNADGSFEVKEILNESILMEALTNTSYKRDELIPILPQSAGGPGQAGPGGEEVEWEPCGGPGEPDCPEPQPGGEGGEPTGMKDGKEISLGKQSVTISGDPGGTGSLISKAEGKRLAREAGHPVQSSMDVNKKWNDARRELMDKVEGGGGSGGGMGGMLKAALKRLMPPDVNWQQEFRRFVADAYATQKKWKLGNRRHMRAGSKIVRYGAKKQKNNINTVAVLVDVSGSMSASWIAKIINEVNSMVLTGGVKEVVIVYFDGVVDLPSIQKLKKGQPPYIPTHIPGGGGTLFQNPLDYLEEKYPGKISLCVFATDGLGFDNGPLKVPKFHNKFIWLLYGDKSIEQMREDYPFGRLLKISDGTED
jgi:predicted metal-dependent peptidase